MPLAAAGGCGAFSRRSTGGIVPRRSAWLRRNLFSSPFNTALTIVVLALIALVVAAAVSLGGDERHDLRRDPRRLRPGRRLLDVHQGTVAALLLRPLSSRSERWRVGAAFAADRAFLVPVLREHVRHRGIWLLLLLTLFPLIVRRCCCGGVFGLAYRRHQPLGRAHAGRDHFLRHRRRFAAAGHRAWRSAGAPPCRSCGGCPSASSNCGAGCRC